MDWTGYEEEPHVVTGVKRIRGYSGSHKVIETEEPEALRHFIDNWSPYESWNGNGEIHLNGEEDEYEYGNITDEDDEQVEQEPFNLGWLMMLTLLFIAVVLVIDYIYNYKKNKVREHETEQEHA